MITERHVRSLIDEKLEGTDLYLVDVAVDSANRIRVEIDHKEGVSIQQCVEMSRYLEQSLDRDQEDFELQVSSPGLDQGFKVLQQYRKSEGKEVEVRLKDGSKQTGTLLEVREDGFTIETKKKERVEGKKKKQLVVEQKKLLFEEVQETKRIISFK